MATTHIISYDLCTPGKKYDKLIEAIKSFPFWAKITESCWIIETSSTTEQVRSSLKTHMDGNDRIFVGELTGAAAWTNVICDSETLKKRLVAQIERQKNK